MAAPSRPRSPGFSSTAVLNRGMAGQNLQVDAVEDGVHVAVDRGRAGHVEFQAGGAILRGVRNGPTMASGAP
jgi:hypothetical protein